MRLRSTDGLRKYARDLPRGKRSRRTKFDVKEFDEWQERTQKAAAELKAKRLSAASDTEAGR